MFFGLYDTAKGMTGKRLMLFKKEEFGDISFECRWVEGDPDKGFLYKYGLTVAKKLKTHRHIRQHTDVRSRGGTTNIIIILRNSEGNGKS